MASSYAGVKIALATKHNKEDVIAPAFYSKLGADIVVPQIDTDRLGTFSGEIEREGNALETAIKKARMAMEITGLKFGLASEGSFGPHPLIPFLAYDSELIVFVDKQNDFILHEMIISEETNYRHGVFTNIFAALKFAEDCQFPSHAVILRPEPRKSKAVVKGIQNQTAFEAAFLQCHSLSVEGQVWVETDMRAQFNPTRMKVIGYLAEKLAARLATRCPSCNAPGWGQTGREAGLPCEMCGAPTEITAYEIFGCTKCSHREKFPKKDGLEVAPASQCQECNP